MSCCDGCAKSGKSCGDRKDHDDALAAWTVGGRRLRAGHMRVGALAFADPALPSDQNWANGATVGYVGGAATVGIVWLVLSMMRGR